MATLIPGPYVALNPADAEALGLGGAGESDNREPGLRDGTSGPRAGTLAADRSPVLELTLPGGVTLRLPLRLRKDLPPGTVALPVGIPGAPWFAPGVTATLRGGGNT